MFPIKGNFAMCIGGPSGSGKTSFCVQLLNNADQIFELHFDKIYWVLGDINAKPANLNIPVEFLTEIPDEFSNDSGNNHLFIIDDMMEVVGNSKEVAELMTKETSSTYFSHYVVAEYFPSRTIFTRSKFKLQLSHSHAKSSR